MNVTVDFTVIIAAVDEIHADKVIEDVQDAINNIAYTSSVQVKSKD